MDKQKKENDRAAPNELKVGDFVSWNSSGGRAKGKITKVERDGTINVPDSDFTLNGTEDDPAALIQVYRSGEPTDIKVGHKFSTLRKINPIRDFDDFNSHELEKHPLNSEEISMEDKEDRHILNVSETDSTVVVEFAKHEDEEIAVEETAEYMDEEDRKVSAEINYRTIDLSRASYIDKENRRVRIGVSSETPVERSFGKEVLSHNAEDIDMSFMASGTAPLLDGHDMDRQIGVIEEFKLDETAKRTIAVVRFGRSSLADEVYRDVLDGIKRNISVGYSITKMERTKNDIFGEHYRASWMPVEASVVSVPADQSKMVGVGRSKDKQKQTTKVKIMENEKQEINLDEVRSQTTAKAKADFQKNSKEILDLASRHGQRDLADKAISEGISVEEFRGVLLDNISNNQPLETPSEIGLTEKETKRFSILRAINALANPTDRKAQEAAAFEFECSNAAAEAQRTTAQGIMLPTEILNNWSQRDLNSSDDSTLIAEDYRGGSFIDVLRNNSAVMPLATNLQGLSGDVKIPKKTAASSASFISSEGGDASESEFTMGSVTMSMRTLGAFTEMTRQLLIQSSLDVENLVRDDLARAMALKIDDVAIGGSGSSGNPTGILNTTGINSISLSSAAAPTFTEMVSMETAVAVDNALVGDLHYIMTPSNYGTLKTTAKIGSSEPVFVADNGIVNGYNTIRSNQISPNNYIFGNFSDLLIGFFGGLDLTVDPYSLSKSGTVRIVALQSCDVAVRNAVSFCKAS